MRLSIQHGRLIDVIMDVVEKARERHAQLKAQIEAAESMRPEFERLEAFLKQADEIEQQLAADDMNTAKFPRSRAFGGDGEMTGDMAAKVLETHGPRLHIDRILDGLYEDGWVGSKIRKKDYKNVYQNLSSKPKRFRSLGGATFEIIREETKTEQGR